MAGRGWTQDELVTGVLAGDRRALARSISLVEDGEADGTEIVRRVYPSTGRAASIGVTGPPGVGKSSLVSALVGHARSLGRSVGVVSVDPSSPFTRGALLGDRIRLADHFLDPERLHPLDGHARAPRRPRRGDAPGAPARRRIREGRRLPRDGRHRPERGRGDRHRRRRPARADARLRRRGAGAQGRDHGDPRRDRGQQDGPPRGEDDAAGGAVDRRARPRSRAAAGDPAHRGAPRRGRPRALGRAREAAGRARRARRARRTTRAQPERRGRGARRRTDPSARTARRCARTTTCARWWRASSAGRSIR